MAAGKLLKSLVCLVQEGRTEEALQFIQECENLETSYLLHKKSGDSLLHDLATIGATQVIEAILVKYPDTDINIRNFDGKTALHDACQQGHLDTVHLLLQHEAKVNTLKKADWSPAMLAVTHPGRLEILKLLVEFGADLTLCNKDGWTAFQIGSRSGDLEVLQFILNIHQDAWTNVSKNGRTSLHTASLAGQTDVVQFLLKIGADPNSVDSCGNTPFMDSIRSANMETFQLYVSEPRLKPDECDKLGRNAVHVAAECGQVEAVIKLKQIGLDMESKTESGQTPLHYAAKEGQVEVVKFLLQEKVDIYHRDVNGRSALFLSVSSQHTDTSAILLHSGAEMTGDNTGTSIEILARKQDLWNSKEFFKRGKADVPLFKTNAESDCCLAS